LGKAQWREELDRGIARALVMQARAKANLGKMDEALVLAQHSYEAFPTAEGAREIGRCLDKMGRFEEAVPHLADAFTIVDARNTDAGRARDRGRMGDMYRKLHGSEKGLGDLLLESYDRTSALVAARRLQLQENDPNARATGVLDFTLTGLQGDPLQLASLKGKTLVLEFWATWCAPCRAMHPLYEEVRRRFRATPAVAFLSVNADDDRSQVAPFLKELGWQEPVWFEDGLTRMLRIVSIPTTVIVDQRGEVVSRINGFTPDHFADQLTQRIQETLQ
jgi:thiol-disulfide isomerase/thioredoxin